MSTALDVIAGLAPHHVEQGDALSWLRGLPDGCVHLAISSPPYWSLRSYLPDTNSLKSLELGSEKIPDCENRKAAGLCGECFVCRLVAVYREVRRVLHPTGVCVVNLGDSYASGGRSDYGPLQKQDKQATNGAIKSAPRSDAGLPDGNMVGIPWRFALAMQSDGWILRSEVMWAKLCPMPASLSGWRWERHRVKESGGKRGREPQRNGTFPERPQQDHDGKAFAPSAEWSPCPGCPRCEPNNGYVLRKGSWRPTSAHEQVFVFAKQAGYFSDGEPVRTTPAESTLGRDQYSRITSGKDGAYAVQHDHETPTNPAGANLRDVIWPEDDDLPPDEPDPGNFPSTLELGPEPLGIAFIREPSPDCPVHAGQRGPFFAERRPKSWRRCRCEIISHYAAFPQALVTPFVLAYSAEQVCGECGMPYARVVEKEIVGDNLGKRHDNPRAGIRGSGMSRPLPWSGEAPPITLGFRPTCTHGATTLPSVVLDIFTGSGQTGIVARRHGRRFLGVELSPDYAEIARRRIGAACPLLDLAASAATVEASPGLFDHLETP